MDFSSCLKGLKISMDNKGESLVITLTGDKELVAKAEAKLRAVHELCGSGDCCNCCK